MVPQSSSQHCDQRGQQTEAALPGLDALVSQLLVQSPHNRLHLGAQQGNGAIYGERVWLSTGGVATNTLDSPVCYLHTICIPTLEGRILGLCHGQQCTIGSEDISFDVLFSFYLPPQRTT